MTEIEIWLHGNRDYNKGVQLYQKYGRNFNLMRVFLRGEDEYNREKLLYELDIIKHQADQLPISIGKQVNIVEAASNAAAKMPEYDRTKLIVEEKPDKYNELHKRWRAAFKLASHLHQTKLVMDIHKNERAAATAKIMELFENEISPCWDMIDYFDKNGHFPENLKEKKEYSTPAEMLKRRNNLRTYITKFKDDVKKMAQVEAWTMELKELNIKLNEPSE